jgi:hypothetical protein
MWNTAVPEALASKWSWKSQPLLESVDQDFKIRNIEVVATSAGSGSTITVSITGFNEEGDPVVVPDVVIPLADQPDRPQVVDLDVFGQAEALTYIQVKMVGQRSNTLLAAPKLHSLTLGVVDMHPRSA